MACELLCGSDQRSRINVSGLCYLPRHPLGMLLVELSEWFSFGVWHQPLDILVLGMLGSSRDGSQSWPVTNPGPPSSGYNITWVCSCIADMEACNTGYTANDSQLLPVLGLAPLSKRCRAPLRPTTADQLPVRHSHWKSLQWFLSCVRRGLKESSGWDV